MNLFLTLIVALHLLSNSFVTAKLPRRTPYYEDFLTYFINEAPLYDANYDKNLTENVPWADKYLLRRSTDFYLKNYVGLKVLHMNSLIEALALKTISSVVQTTKSCDDVPGAYERMLTTLMYVQILCEAGPEILNPESNVGKGIKLIRQRHRSAAYLADNRSIEALEALKDNSLSESPPRFDFVPDRDTRELVWALRADMATVDTSEAPKDIGNWDFSKPVGQYDLGVAQFFFYGQIVFSPRVFGLFTASDEDIKAHIHFWAVVGRQLGIEDRFNVALHLPLSDYERFYRNTIVASFKNVDEKNIRQMGNLMEGVYRHFLVPTLVRFKCWLFYFLSPLPDFEGRNMLNIMDAEDIVCLQYLGIITGPINLSYTFRIGGRMVLDSWFRQETERLGIIA